MNPDRVKDFHDKMVKAGVIKAGDVDLAKVAVYDFVNKGVGLDIRKKLTGK
jgi:NitT/TauT family transport system substrate-binding protein